MKSPATPSGLLGFSLWRRRESKPPRADPPPLGTRGPPPVFPLETGRPSVRASPGASVRFGFFWSPWAPRRARAASPPAPNPSSDSNTLAYYSQHWCLYRPEVPTVAAVLPWVGRASATGPACAPHQPQAVLPGPHVLHRPKLRLLGLGCPPTGPEVSAVSAVPQHGGCSVYLLNVCSYSRPLLRHHDISNSMSALRISYFRILL